MRLVLNGVSVLGVGFAALFLQACGDKGGDNEDSSTTTTDDDQNKSPNQIRVGGSDFAAEAVNSGDEAQVTASKDDSEDLSEDDVDPKNPKANPTPEPVSLARATKDAEIRQHDPNNKIEVIYFLSGGNTHFIELKQNDFKDAQDKSKYVSWFELTTQDDGAIIVQPLLFQKMESKERVFTEGILSESMDTFTRSDGSEVKLEKQETASFGDEYRDACVKAWEKQEKRVTFEGGEGDSETGPKSVENTIKKFSREEVAKHNSKEDCWIIIGKHVVDITKYLEEHPGGPEIILEFAGRDATDEFEDVGHSESARQKLQEYVIGEVDDGEVDGDHEQDDDLSNNQFEVGRIVELHSLRDVNYVVPVEWSTFNGSEGTISKKANPKRKGYDEFKNCMDFPDDNVWEVDFDNCKHFPIMMKSQFEKQKKPPQWVFHAANISPIDQEASLAEGRKVRVHDMLDKEVALPKQAEFARFNGVKGKLVRKLNPVEGSEELLLMKMLRQSLQKPNGDIWEVKLDVKNKNPVLELFHVDNMKIVNPVPKGTQVEVPEGAQVEHFTEGSKVEVRYRGGRRYYPGKIARKRLNGTYDILYDDGEKELGVGQDFIKLALQVEVPEGAQVENFKEGANVDVRYRGGVRYYPGKITRKRLDGTYDVLYNDGEKEMGVDQAFIKLALQVDFPEGAQVEHFTEGTKVEVRYRGDRLYYPGKIIRKGRNRYGCTYDILYDDGEKERGVDQAYIRLVPLSPREVGVPSSPSGQN